MTTSSTVTAKTPEPLPRLRSRGAAGAGSSEYSGRRNPRATGRSVSIRSAEVLASARATLLAQRSFRVQQLRELNTVAPDSELDAARSEVHRTLRAAAVSALRDIDAALRRIRQGSFGRCATCGDELSVERLNALPVARSCGRCQVAAARRPVTG